MTAQEVIFDWQRKERIGFEEAIFCQGKTALQLTRILETAQTLKASLLLTRLSMTQHEALPAQLRASIDYEPVSRTAYFNKLQNSITTPGVAIIAAGASDAPVTLETSRTLSYHGVANTLFQDIGVAGLWRLLERLDKIKEYPVLIAIAGMDAALPTVLGGLVSSALIAVPSSNGYGVAKGGHTALNAVLASCAPGIMTMNIDNGYGAACAAMRILSVAKNLQ